MSSPRADLQKKRQRPRGDFCVSQILLCWRTDSQMRTEHPLPSFHVYTPGEGLKWSEQGMEWLRSRRREGSVDHQVRRNGTHVRLPIDTAIGASSFPGSALLSLDKVITVILKAFMILKIRRTPELSHGQLNFSSLNSDSEYVSMWVGRHSETHIHTYTFHFRAVCSTSWTRRGRKMVF